MDDTKTYTTKGAVRGCCGHAHRSLDTALRCLARDRAGCRSQGGYSDRSIEDSDGEAYVVCEGDDGYRSHLYAVPASDYD